jgi:hypothetical protein
MRLSVNAERLISDVQSDFSLAYPFLKIEFFRNGNIRMERYAVDKRLGRHLRLKEAWFLNKREGEIEFNDNTTVLEFEKAFMDQFGLSVQMFRKSGNVWLETTITDNWTLKQQHDHGREISIAHSSQQPEKPDDYGLSRLQ